MNQIPWRLSPSCTALSLSRQPKGARAPGQSPQFERLIPVACSRPCLPSQGAGCPFASLSVAQGPAFRSDPAYPRTALLSHPESFLLPPALSPAHLFPSLTAAPWVQLLLGTSFDEERKKSFFFFFDTLGWFADHFYHNLLDIICVISIPMAGASACLPLVRAPHLFQGAARGAPGIRSSSAPSFSTGDPCPPLGPSMSSGQHTCPLVSHTSSCPEFPMGDVQGMRFPGSFGGREGTGATE